MSNSTLHRPALFTVGHSTHEIGRFIEILRSNRVQAVADVRSSPYSRFNPQFNREPLRQALEDGGIDYVFLGRELGARREEDSCYRNGRVDYRSIPNTALFQEGLSRIRRGTEDRTIALMCAEKDPIDCHRMILICRHLKSEFNVRHILADGTIETQTEAEERLLRATGSDETSLFASDEERLDGAYDIQGDRIAYQPTSDDSPVERTA